MIKLTWIKRQAKKIKKELGITHTKALDVAAQQSGFGNYKHLLKEQGFERDI